MAEPEQPYRESAAGPTSVHERIGAGITSFFTGMIEAAIEQQKRREAPVNVTRPSIEAIRAAPVPKGQLAAIISIFHAAARARWMLELELEIGSRFDFLDLIAKERSRTLAVVSIPHDRLRAAEVRNEWENVVHAHLRELVEKAEIALATPAKGELGLRGEDKEHSDG